jgi:hypothetical protein
MEEDLVRFAKMLCSRMRTQSDMNACRDFFFDPWHLAIHGLRTKTV